MSKLAALNQDDVWLQVRGPGLWHWATSHHPQQTLSSCAEVPS